MRYLLPLLSACGAAALAVAADEKPYEATPFTEQIGTIKLEGPLGDKSGDVYVCNVQQEGLEFTWKEARRGNIAKFTPDGRMTIAATLPEGQRGNGMQWAPDGQLLVADQLGGSVLKVDPKTGVSSIHFKFPDGSGSPNDLAMRSDGTLYVSFFNDGLWTISPDGKEGKKVGNGFHNGIDLSPDEKLLHSEKKTYDVAPDGSLSHARPLLQVPKNEEGFSFTDGIRTDAAGNIYMARFGGRQTPADPKSPKLNGVIHMFGPDGTLIRNIPVPAPEVTNLTFGGVDGHSVFVTHPGVKGFLSVFRAENPGRAWRE